MLKKLSYLVVICSIVLTIKALSAWHFFSITHDDPTTIVGSGNVIETNYPINNVKEIHASANFVVYFSQGPVESLILKIEDNILPYVDISVDNGRLQISYKSGTTIKTTKPAIVIIQTEQIEKMKMSGAAHVFGSSISTNKFEINLSGAAKANFDEINADIIRFKASGASKITSALTSKQMEIELSGTSSSTLTGNATTIKTNVSGACKYDALRLIANTYIIDASGATKLKLHANSKIEGHASGATTIKYSGNPDIKVRTSGVSRVQKNN